MKQSRGRPRKYDEYEVLEAAGLVFWDRGYSGTSLDDLSSAMGMNRPSIYRAFGDKEAIYRTTLMRFGRKMEQAFKQSMLTDEHMKVRLKNFYERALEVYLGGDHAKGCMVMSTAVAAATQHPDIQADLLGVIRDLDGKLLQQFEQAAALGQIDSSLDASGLALMAQSLLHSLSLRARAGETRERLMHLIEGGVDLLTA